MDETAGYWGGLLVRNNVRTSSTIANLVLRHGGGGAAPALRLDAAIRLNDVRLELNKTGAQIGAQGLDDASTNLSITTTEAVPLTLLPNALISLPEGGVFTGNQTDHIAIQAGDYSVTGTVPNLGVPYRVLGPIDTGEQRQRDRLRRGDDYVEVSHGADYCLRVQNPITVTNSTFSTCTGAGILKDADDAGLYTDTNTFTAVGTNVATP